MTQIFMNVKELSNRFLLKGYVCLKSFFSEEQLNSITQVSNEILEKSKKGQWKHIRVYREYPTFFGNINLFGVDYPLNKDLNDKTFDEIQKLNYKNQLLEILGWKNFKTTLIRLHTNSSFYNYQGEWHRDDSSYPSPSSVQAIIYLLDEKGYRIVPKNKNHLLENYNISTNRQRDPDRAFAKLPKDIYDEIVVQKGDILVHDSGLLHQGFCKEKRLHYHLRHIKFEKINNTNGDIFNFSVSFKKNFDLSKINSSNKFNYNETRFKAKLKRLMTFVLYFFPRFKSILNNCFNKNKQSIFHSTIWQ